MAKPRILKQRKELVAYIKNAGHPLKFVNGGGTGSLVFTKTDEVVTELAAGSGVFAPTLFDYYDDFKLSSALFYALEITRHPQKNIYTANGGGYVASGAIGLEKLPCSYYQGEFVLTAHEGVGEVQTPMIFQKPQQVGNPVYFRHAKSGEICERFNQIHVLDKGKLLKTVNTYRGDGQCFF
jgi:D-serine deaminase-like pyridoxal phosphate-dependent protein